MKILWLLALLGLSACAQVPPGSNQEQGTRSDATYRAQIHTELAAHYFSRGQYRVAFTEVREALSSDPDYAPAYNVRALVHARLLEDEQAEDSFRKAMALSPNFSEVRNNYGYFLCQRQRYAEALPMFEAAVRNPLYPSPEKPLANGGYCALLKGDLPLAENFLLRALARARNQPTALLGMAEWEFRHDNFPAARSHLKLLQDTGEYKAQTAWLLLRLERAAGNRDPEAMYAGMLRRQYPESEETRLLLGGRYDAIGGMP